MSNIAFLSPSHQCRQLDKHLKIWHDQRCSSIITNPVVIDSISQCGNNHPNHNVKVLKLGTRRCIISIDTDDGPLVIKSFPLTTLREKFKYKKYGLAEITHNKKASLLGIPTPKYYAYFESRRFGLVDINGCVMEHLTNYSPLEEIRMEKPETYALAIPTLANLFSTGVNHIDISPSNIFYSEDLTDFRIIDWQYCSFCRPRNPLQLATQAAHFLRGITPALDPGIQSEWLDQLYQATSPDIPKQAFISAVTSLQANKISIKDRLTLNIDGNALFTQKQLYPK